MKIELQNALIILMVYFFCSFHTQYFNYIFHSTCEALAKGRLLAQGGKIKITQKNENQTPRCVNYAHGVFFVHFILNILISFLPRKLSGQRVHISNCTDLCVASWRTCAWEPYGWLEIGCPPP